MKFLGAIKKLLNTQRLDLRLRSKLLFIAGVATFSISVFTFAIGGLSAITWPTVEPAGEASGGLFGQYFRNMFGADDPLTGGKECVSSGVIVGFEYDGMPRCKGITSLLGASIGVPSVNFTSDRNIITNGESVLLSWTSINGDTCAASGAWNGTKALNNAESVSPSSSTGYTLTCTNIVGQTDSKTLNITVLPNPDVTLSVSSTSIIAGNSVTLSWTGMNITTCTKTGDWTGSANISGTFTTPALSSNKTYTLTCQNNLGTSVLKTVSVNVTTPTSPTVLFGVSGGNTKVTPGSTITLQWTSTNATSCSLFFSTRETNGTQIVSPTKNERYDLSCVSADGVWVTQYVWVSMVYNTPTLTLSASKSSVSPGENVILTWSSANATTCTAGGGWSGSKAISGTESVSVSLTTEYTLTCNNPQYNITQTVTINIVLTFVGPEGDELVTAEGVVCVRNRVDKKIACWGNNNSSTYPWYPYLGGTNHDITAFTVGYVQDSYGQWPTNVIWRNNNGELTHLQKDGRNCTTTFGDQNCYTWAGGGNIAKLANGLGGGECRLYTDGSVWCEGQGQTVPSNLGSTVKDVSVGGSYVCALKTDNTVRCWSNGGNPASNNTPSNLTNVAQISSGKNHFCALQYDGTFQCWGNYTYSSTISGVRDVIKITAGTVATCVLKASHVVKCFGLVDPPAEINSNVIDVSARGNNYACLTQSDGSVRCWGGNVPNGTPYRVF